MTETARRKKLIEVALPLDEINAACKADKDRKTGTIRNIHKWFAPMPLPAWRALLFAALVDDPVNDNGRAYLLDLIKRLVANGADLPDDATLAEAQEVLGRAYPDGLPTVLDPFAGGGSTLVEAQRLGLGAEGSDLNPVPTLISRALTETLPAVWGAAPGLADEHAAEDGHLFSKNKWFGYEGIVADIDHAADIVLERAKARLGSFFPSRANETIVAWLWARTAVCANPACGVRSVLSTNWWLSKKRGDLAWIEPKVVDGDVRLDVRSGLREGGPVPESPKLGRGAQFECVACGALIAEKSLIEQGKTGRLGTRLVAVVYDDASGDRRYRAPRAGEESAALGVPPVDDLPEIALPDIPRWFSGPRFGLTKQTDLYTPRQLLVLATFAELVAELHAEFAETGMSTQRSRAISTALGLCVGKLAQYNSAQGRWFLRQTAHAKAVSAFDRHDVPMMWDFPEVNAFDAAVGGWKAIVKTTVRALAMLPDDPTPSRVTRSDARTAASSHPGLVATDPPYFDAIGYADVSDFFYVWHRRALRGVHPDLYATLAVPKQGELTAIPYHHGNNAEHARDYFIQGFTETFENLKSSLADDLPLLVVYASKEQRAGRDEETRWSSILTAIVQAGLEITGTWPIHGSGTTRMVGIGTNAIATYIVMVCRPRSGSADSTSLSDFNRALRRELGPALHDLQAASIRPEDLAQAVMGPGMQIYSRYRAVVDQGGSPVNVDQAIRSINAARAEVLDEQVGELDPASQFAVRWWESHGWAAAPFDEANKVARPLGISVDDVKRAQVATSEGNKLRLLGDAELDPHWAPSGDAVPTAWEAVHHLANRLADRGGEVEAARLMALLGELQDSAMRLVYRLHEIAARKDRREDQERYNALIGSWTELVKLSAIESTTKGRLF